MAERKRCRECQRRLSLSRFPLSKNRLGQTYPTPDCEKCTRRLRFALDISRRYGVTVEEYAWMLHRQDGLCAVCGEEMQRPYVDHCHDTEKVRGLLCNHCNLGIGHLRDDVSVLASAIRYLVA